MSKMNENTPKSTKLSNIWKWNTISKVGLVVSSSCLLAHVIKDNAPLYLQLSVGAYNIGVIALLFSEL